MEQKPKSSGIGCLVFSAMMAVTLLLLVSLLTGCSKTSSSTSGCHWELEKKKSKFSHSFIMSSSKPKAPKFHKPKSHNSRTGTRMPLKPTITPKKGYVWELDCD